MGGTGGFAGRRARSRRSVLRAASAVVALPLLPVAVSACDSGPPSIPPPPDALVPLLTQTRELAARYDAAIAAQPTLTERLTPLRDALNQHAATLGQLIAAPAGASPTATATPPASPAAALAELRAAEQAAQRSATDFCLDAPGGRAPLLGSIVAAHATHQAVLA